MLIGDLMTLYLFEILSFTSFTWVIHEQTKGRSKQIYLSFIAVFGGLVLFMGLACSTTRPGLCLSPTLKRLWTPARTGG